MSYPSPWDARNEREESTVARAQAAAAIAADFREQHDREGSFPVEGLAELASNGYLALTVPLELGGENTRVSELVLGNMEIAKGDPSLALVAAMHHSFFGRVRDTSLWPRPTFERVARTIAAARSGRGALINSLATEPESGSPSRGALPQTTAIREADSWVLNGRKTFSTGAPVLYWAAVSARVDGAGEPHQSNFLVPLQSPGVSLDLSWDTLSMRATGSHTVVLDGVRVPLDAEIPRPSTPGAGVKVPPYEKAWVLTVAAVYLGAAEAARDCAVDFARNRRPTSLAGKSIGTVPHIRARAGHLDFLLYRARGLLVATARAWDEQTNDRGRIAMDAALAAAKVNAANEALTIADEAMRLVGGAGLQRGMALEQFFRDVRPGINHPPQEDAAVEQLAREALD